MARLIQQIAIDRASVHSKGRAQFFFQGTGVSYPLV